MFFKHKESSSQTHHIDTLVGANAAIVGDVAFRGGLRIDGTVEGNVSVSFAEAGCLCVGERGSIHGDVRVTDLILDGAVVGSVFATGRVEIHASGRIQGDVHAGIIEIHAGAVIDGRIISNDGKADEKRLPQAKLP